MTDRERLIEILSTKVYPREGIDPAAVIADFLLDNDVVPVVRCKDCRNLRQSGSGWYCNEYGGTITPQDYCSRGERIADGE